MKASSILVKNIGQLVTLAPLAQTQRCSHIRKSDLGILNDAWLWVNQAGQVEGAGEGAIPATLPEYIDVVDAKGGLVLPGFVDSHTHLVWAGSRAKEMERRLSGETYQQIAASGGGIASTVRATRLASDEDLASLCLARAQRLLALGVTTLEVKSGYGLSIEEELRHLRIIKHVGQTTPQTLSPTCLALHAPSPEYKTIKAWVEQCTQKLLPIVAKEKLADAVDAFIEQGYYSVADVEPYVACAKKLGLKIRLHADEFSDSGAALAAAKWGAASADHLQCASKEAPLAMAQNGVTATLLPGTSLYTKLAFTSGRPFADAGVPVAIASDFNPGSCMIDNLPMLATIACIHAGLTPEEAIAGITFVPAMSLGYGNRKGSLSTGYDADFLLYYNLSNTADWIGDFGRTCPSEVWIQGRREH
jgi:imidazolonepropionase